MKDIQIQFNDGVNDKWYDAQDEVEEIQWQSLSEEFVCSSKGLTKEFLIILNPYYNHKEPQKECVIKMVNSRDKEQEKKDFKKFVKDLK